MAQRPNVILFIPEDMGFGDLGCHGNPMIQTPHLDRFASESIEFNRFYVSPVCAPTRASLLTGRHNFRTGVADVFPGGCELNPDEITLADRLRDTGYATGLFGKWHLGDGPDERPSGRGFGEVLSFPGIGLHADHYTDPPLLHNDQPVHRDGYCMDIFTDAAIDFIRDHREEPFFICLPSNLLHTPLVAPDDQLARYADIPSNRLSDETRTTYAMASNVDDNFGRLRAALQELGLEDDTLMIVTSDHGPCSGSRPIDRYNAGLHGQKGTVYDHGVRVMCFMRWPNGFDAGVRAHPVAAHIDIMPTVLEACGINPGEQAKPLDGRSLLPLLRDADADWPDRYIPLQWDSGLEPRYNHAWCVVGPKWKLVQPVGMDAENQQHIRDMYTTLCRVQGRGERSIEGEPRHELYDMVNDPGEHHDRAAEHPDIVAEMRAVYDAWFADVTSGQG